MTDGEDSWNRVVDEYGPSEPEQSRAERGTWVGGNRGKALDEVGMWSVRLFICSPVVSLCILRWVYVFVIAVLCLSHPSSCVGGTPLRSRLGVAPCPSRPSSVSPNSRANRYAVSATTRGEDMKPLEFPAIKARHRAHLLGSLPRIRLKLLGLLWDLLGRDRLVDIVLCRLSARRGASSQSSRGECAWGRAGHGKGRGDGGGGSDSASAGETETMKYGHGHGHTSLS